MYYKSNLPYPDIKVEKENIEYARLLSYPYAGLVSEDTATHLYMYQSFILDKKIEDNKDLKKQVKEAAEKDVNKNYDICIFAGIQIKSKNYYGICFADILKKRDIEFKTNDLDLGIIYPWASSNCEREYICKDGKAKYVYEFIVSAGDDYQSTVYFCNKRLSKEFLTEFDYLNSINAIEWF